MSKVRRILAKAVCRRSVRPPAGMRSGHIGRVRRSGGLVRIGSFRCRDRSNGIGPPFPAGNEGGRSTAPEGGSFLRGVARRQCPQPAERGGGGRRASGRRFPAGRRTFPDETGLRTGAKLGGMRKRKGDGSRERTFCRRIRISRRKTIGTRKSMSDGRGSGRCGACCTVPAHSGNPVRGDGARANGIREGRVSLVL